MNRLILIFVFATGLLHAQKPADTFLDGSPYIDPQPYIDSVDAADILQHLSTLAADDMEGRETGTEGCKKAAQYIASHFEQLGLSKISEDDTYFQKISFLTEFWNEASLKTSKKEFKHLRDFYALPWLNPGSITDTISEIIFLGFGIDDVRYSDYLKSPDLNGKTIMIFDGEPLNAGKSWINTSGEPSDWNTDVRKKLLLAKKAGVKNVLIIDPFIKANIATHRNKILNSQASMGEPEGQNYPTNLFISSTLAKKILGNKWKKVGKIRKKIETRGKPKNLTVDTELTISLDKQQNLLQSQNVVGLLPGADPSLKGEAIVVSAHYDHLGKRGTSIFNGADDNGSGTSTLLDLAEAFTLAKHGGKSPKRSILFMLLSGEEKGLLGSAYYVEHPLWPLDKTIANVNIDMIGRTDEAHKNNENYVYVIGADKLSSELHYINEAANKRYVDLALDYTYNDENDPNQFYYRSDHYNFAKNGIPAIFYFSGVHKDYHRPEDDVEKILVNKVAKIGKLAFGTIWELANRAKTIEVDK